MREEGIFFFRGGGLYWQWKRLRRKKAFQIILIQAKDIFVIEGKVFSVDLQVSFDIKRGRKMIVSVFFDGFEMVFLYFGE